MNNRWYLKNEQLRESISKVLQVLNGFTYEEAINVLDYAINELRFTSFVCQAEATHQQCDQTPHSTLAQNLQD